MPVPPTTSGPSPTTSEIQGAPKLSRLGILALCLLVLATWALSHPYRGLFHDAGLYTLLALAHLHPASLSADVFLKFGSQDAYTLFSPLYSAVCAWWGVEPAAAALTFLFQAALAAAAWALARTVMPASLALLGTAFVIAVPGDYGPGRIFTCLEPFLTPRMAAEALVLAALAAALLGRRLLSIALTLAAGLLHPIMAMAGAFALLMLYAGLRRPIVTAALLIVGLKALALAAVFLPLGPWGRFDATWLTLVKDRSPYLFLASWDLDDWSRLAVTLVTLFIGWHVPQCHTAPHGQVGPQGHNAPHDPATHDHPASLVHLVPPDHPLLHDRVRALCLVTLLTVAAGVVLTAIGCDWLHLVLLTQLQPWRWQWLGTVVAAVTLPYIVYSRWHAGTNERTTLMLLLAAWAFGSTPYALVAAVAALLSLIGIHRLKDSEARWIFWGALGLLALAVVWRVATNLEFTDAHYLDPHLSGWIRRSMSFSRDGTAPMALLALAWWLARTHARSTGTAGTALAVLAAGACAALLPATWDAWTTQEIQPQRAAQFAAWRPLIPPGSEVFWPESPVDTWLLLDRPSYLSVIQTSGMVFSRTTALELNRRAQSLRAAVAPQVFMNWNNAGTGFNLSASQLEQACKAGEFAFMVTGAKLSFEPLAVVPAPTGPANRQIGLYRCPLRTGVTSGSGSN